MKNKNDILLGWGLPTLCVAISSIAIFTQFRTFTDASNQLEKTQGKAAALTIDKAKLEQSMGRAQVAAVPKVTSEQTSFLGEMRRRAADSKTTIIKWNSVADESVDSATTSTPAGATPEPKAGDLDASKSLPPIIRSRGELTLVGSYPRLQQFLYGLQRSSRLYTISNVTWTRKEGGLELAFTISRYTELPTPNVSTSGNV